MNNRLRIPLHAPAEHQQKLIALQEAFAQVCNWLAPLVQQTRCWNRVALHHMTYRQLRARFPDLGSQMICNAIYSVSRTSRHIYQHPKSPFNVAKLGDQPLPQLWFRPNNPVYFDRHTLSIRSGQLSMYTLEGRLQFRLEVPAAIEQRFREERLREIVLMRPANDFVLDFRFGDGDDEVESPENLPEYVVVTDSLALPPPSPQATAMVANP